MDAHTLQVLDYDKIKAMVGRHLSTGLGREVLSALEPESHPERVRAQLRVTSEARRAVDQLLEAPLDPVHDLRPLLTKIVPEGSYLDARELLQARDTLKTVERAVAFCRELPPELSQLRRWGDDLQPQTDCVAEIDRAIDDEGLVKDSASRELKAVRRSIREAQDWIVRRLEKLLRRISLREYLQEPYFTQREGRYVLPVQSKYKSKVRGIVHDCSDTGTTTFIEPNEIVDWGNRLRELHNEEAMEIRKVLRALSALLRRAADPIRWNLEILAQIDFAFAKGRLSAVLGMQEPEIATDGVLRMRGGRHPLLVEKLKDKVVPLDLELGGDLRGIVISGPNAGGKTVVLKTVGTLCLMAASGLHVPAGDGTRMVLYSNILADIGDEQSLEQNLSTFTSHMSQISRFLTESDGQTLVLLDEIGAGTDPVEGGVLGVAILTGLRERGACVLVTTHLNDLKVLAYQTEGLENAAMEFDAERLQPTYRLYPGSTGGSFALDIAARLGMPRAVISQARARLNRDQEDAGALLEQLSSEGRRAAEARRGAEAERQKVESLRLELARRLDRAKQERDQVLERTRHEARSKIEDLRRSIRDAETQLHSLVQQAESAAVREEIQKAAGEVEPLKQKELALCKKASRQFTPPEEPPRWEPVEPERLRPGQSVHLHGFTRPGELLSLDLKKREAEVQVQAVHVRVPLNRILGIVKNKERPAPAFVPVTVEAEINEELPHSLDIHGMTQDEAYPILEKYIDSAHLAGWQQVYVIHGHGTGVLRQMTQRLLEKHPLVHSFRPGDYFEGGKGVTVTRLHG